MIVTGATAGFGLCIARGFVADGARLIAAGRRRDRLEALAAELPSQVSLPSQVLPLTLDVTIRAAAAQTIAGLPARVNVNLVQAMPVVRSCGPLRMHHG